jgi:hypothetical protein
MRLVEVGACEMRPGEVGAFEMRPAEPGACEMRHAEVGAFEMRLAEAGACEMRLAEVGAVEMRAAEVGAFEMRLVEASAFEMRLIEASACEMRHAEVGAFEMRPDEEGAFEMRPDEEGAFEMRLAEVGAFEMRLVEASAAKVRLSQVQAPVSQLLTLSPGVRPAMEDLENRCNIRCRRRSLLQRLIGSAAELPQIGLSGHFRRFWLFPPRSLAHERRQRLHHRPIQIRHGVGGWGLVSTQTPPPGRRSHLDNRFYGEALQRVDATQPRFDLFVGELLHRLAEALGDPPLLFGAGLFVIATGCRAGLLDRRPDQTRPAEPSDDRIYLVRMGHVRGPPLADPGHGSLPPPRCPEPRQPPPAPPHGIGLPQLLRIGLGLGLRDLRSLHLAPQLAGFGLGPVRRAMHD